MKISRSLKILTIIYYCQSWANCGSLAEGGRAYCPQDYGLQGSAIPSFHKHNHLPRVSAPYFP